ncbi:MAG: archaeal flagellar protein FlaF [Thermococcaceae archaeon]|nr:archaeal flagellar protein FlaF [Thermococcaceae archaeon]MDK2914993.1 archaeal flagellar protein FlaF [Thermococcaceae archaeon]
MGFSVSAAFAVIAVAVIASFGVIYASGENAYFSIMEASEEHSLQLTKIQTAELELVDYNYTARSDIPLYDIWFEIMNSGTTLSPNQWVVIYDGNLGSPSVTLPAREYLLPGEELNVTVQNIPKDPNVTHALVISTETGCALKVKWVWSGNSTNGSPQVVGSAWYCPLEG